MFHAFLGSAKDPLHRLKVLDPLYRNAGTTSKLGRLHKTIQTFTLSICVYDTVPSFDVKSIVLYLITRTDSLTELTGSNVL